MNIRDIINILETAQRKRYPLAPRDEWYGNMNYANDGGSMVMMEPDEYLSKVRPLVIDEISRESIDDLKDHILSGRTLDPLVIYSDGKEDGRHRANAAKELGIDQVPVIVFPRANRADEVVNEKVASASYLFHATQCDTAVKILDENRFKDRTLHRDDYGRKKDADGRGNIRGVSFSRSIHYPKVISSFNHDRAGVGAVIFVLDRNKVAADNRIEKVDYYKNRNEAEDFVIGSIRNVDRKIIQIIVSQRTYDFMVEEDEILDDGHKQYQDLINHPKLKIV